MAKVKTQYITIEYESDKTQAQTKKMLRRSLCLGGVIKRLMIDTTDATKAGANPAKKTKAPRE